jgi:hypothetical protein
MDDGSATPPEGRIDSGLSSDGPPIPPGIDIRVDGTVLPTPIPMGPTFAVDVTEILKRGYKSLDIDEQASVAAAYLATQRQQLSPFMTPLDEEVARHKLQMETEQAESNSKYRALGIGLSALVVLALLGFIGFFTYMALKQGVLNDSGILQGLFSTVQEVFRAIVSRNY